ncbi:MAG: IS200/IS605 family transposase [Smithellaceae bacterium]|jgi:putative transposase|nr:IS200/IS605 family transposase [Smithellaceae bacterium]
MEGYNRSSHAKYRCEYHFVWVPKYRYHVLVQEIKPRLRAILTELCEWLDITIIEGAICSDHVHMYLSVSPKYSPSQVMKILKGKSAERLRDEFPELGKKYWGMHIWARGYFVSTVGINSAVIQHYVKEQAEEQIREEQLRLWKDDSE